MAIVFALQFINNPNKHSFSASRSEWKRKILKRKRIQKIWKTFVFESKPLYDDLVTKSTCSNMPWFSPFRWRLMYNGKTTIATIILYTSCIHACALHMQFLWEYFAFDFSTHSILSLSLHLTHFSTVFNWYASQCFVQQINLLFKQRWKYNRKHGNQLQSDVPWK